MNFEGLFHARTDAFVSELEGNRGDILKALYDYYEAQQNENVIFIVELDLLNEDESVSDLEFQPIETEARVCIPFVFVQQMSNEACV